MIKLSLLVLPIAALFALPTMARAESLSCVTVNGKESCARGTSNTNCESINGKTECHGDEGSENKPESPLQLHRTDPSQTQSEEDNDPDATPTSPSFDKNDNDDNKTTTLLPMTQLIAQSPAFQLLLEVASLQWAAQTYRFVPPPAPPRKPLPSVALERADLALAQAEILRTRVKPCLNCVPVHRSTLFRRP